MVQLSAFISMNAERHQEAHQQYYNDLVHGADLDAAKHREFYDEYLAVMDLTEEFYLQTIDIVFQSHLLPRGLLEHHGRRVKLEAVTDIALMTVEGEKDDISASARPRWRTTLCANLPEAMKDLYVQPGVGHYGVFNGRRFREEIYPRVRSFIQAHETA